jgi:C4-type Zn-finger protein
MSDWTVKRQCPSCRADRLEVVTQRANVAHGQQRVYGCLRCGYLFVVRWPVWDQREPEKVILS